MSAQGKRWFKSKALWFNIAAGVTTAVIAVVNQDNTVPTQVAVVVTAIGNLILRLLTKEPLTK